MCPPMQQKRRKVDFPRHSELATSGQRDGCPSELTSARPRSALTQTEKGRVMGKVEGDRPCKRGLTKQSIHSGAFSLAQFIYSLNSPMRAKSHSQKAERQDSNPGLCKSRACVSLLTTSMESA